MQPIREGTRNPQKGWRVRRSELKKVGTSPHLQPSRHVVVILTQTVLVFSELETLVRPLSTQGRLSRWQRLSWAWQQPAALRLVNQLQQHKTSSSLMLQIIQWSVEWSTCYRPCLTPTVIPILKPSKVLPPCRNISNNKWKAAQI
jgi:hypothetical protein